MTEYDYSPEAKHKFVEKMNSVARWRDNTISTAQRNPFTPPTPAPISAALPGSGRPMPKRSQTLPLHHRSRSLDVERQYSYNSGPNTQPQRYKSKSSHRSGSSSKHRSDKDRTRSQTLAMTSNGAPVVPGPRRSTTMPQQATGQGGYVVSYGHQSPVYVPNGGAYYPPNGSRPGYVAQPQGQQVYYPSPTYGQQPAGEYYRMPRSPAQSTSLMKKIGVLLGLGNSGKSSKSGKPHRSREHRRRNSWQ